MDNTTEDTVKFVLRKPIQHDGKTYTEFTFREATAGDACVLDKLEGEMTKSLALLSAMSDTPIPVLKKLPFRELKRLTDLVGPLMGNESSSEDNG